MGKKDSTTTNKKQKRKNTNPKKDKQRGRPPKSNPSTQIEIQPFDSNQKQYWFTVDETREIVRILASKCQVLFKCLSGQSANNLKNSFWSATQPQVSFNNFKHKRQAFAEKATELQTELLKKLEQQLQIKLIGEQGQMNYFFFGSNPSDDTSFNQKTQDPIMELLEPYIHQDFKETLTELLKSTNESKSADLYDISKHKHFVSWALVLAWGKEVRDHLTKLQSENKNNQEDDEFSPQIQDTPENLMLESDKILEIKKYEVLQNIDQLIWKYQEIYKKEIDDLISLLSERFLNKK